MVRPGDAGVDGAEVRAERVASDKRFEVVIGIARDVRAHDRQTIGKVREARERASEGDAWHPGGQLARRAPDPVGRGHLRVERLELARPAVEEQKDDRLAGQKAGQALGLCLQRRQVGQREPASADRGRAADSEERAPGVRTVAVDEGQHGASWIEV